MEPQLPTTAELIDRIKDHHKLPSDGAVARLLGITTSSISAHRQLKGSFDDATAIKVADLLGLEYQYVLACAHAQGAKRPEVRTVWERIARGASAAVIALILWGFNPFGGGVQTANASGFFVNTGYTLCEVRRRLKAWFARTLAIA